MGSQRRASVRNKPRIGTSETGSGRMIQPPAIERMKTMTATTAIGVHGTDLLSTVQVDVEHWGVMTIGTELGNARFTNRAGPP